jgi:hypothetical protein
LTPFHSLECLIPAQPPSNPTLSWPITVLILNAATHDINETQHLGYTPFEVLLVIDSNFAFRCFHAEAASVIHKLTTDDDELGVAVEVGLDLESGTGKRNR